MEVKKIPLQNLKVDPKNARAHGKRNLEAIQRSLQTFGQQKPIVIDATSTVVAGNGTLEAARALGWAEIDCVQTDLAGTKAIAFALADNRTAELAAWDEDALAEALAAVQCDESLDAIATGFSEVEIDRAIKSMVGDDGADAIAEPVAESIAKRGDLWLLGDHRLLCGDSTKAEDVTTLMDGQKASLLATDPPYLVDYQGGNHPQNWEAAPQSKDEHWDDYKDPKSGVQFFSSFIRAALPNCIEDVPIYQWHVSLRGNVVREAWDECGLLHHQQIIWAKARPVLTRSHFMWQHEPCSYGWFKGRMPRRRPPPGESSVWQIDQVGESDGIHPTQKPIEIFARPIRYHTDPGDICYEPFSGSGSQIIAAEKLGRRCYAMEIEPAFVDVAVRRWEQYSSKKAVLHGS